MSLLSTWHHESLAVRGVLVVIVCLAAALAGTGLKIARNGVAWHLVSEPPRLQSPPPASIRPRRARQGIPPHLFCTSRLPSTPHFSWADLNPEFRVHFFNDSALEAFVQQHHPRLFKLFPRLRGVERADLFRYLILYVHGGIYTDMDTTCKQPITQWAQEFGYTEPLSELDFIIGLEFEGPNKEERLPFQVVQWTIASAPNNPILHQVLQHCERSVLQVQGSHNEAVLGRTGPFAWTRGVLNALVKFGEPPGVWSEFPFDYPKTLLPMHQLRTHGQLVTLMVEGQRWQGLLLPYRAFGFHPHHGKSPDELTNHLVEHRFEGSWKTPA